MKKRLIFFLYLASVLWIGTVQGQNKQLSGEAAASFETSSNRVIELINATDVSTMLPSLDAYKEVINDLPYANFEMRKENLANVENNYTQQVQDLTANISQFKQEASSKGLDVKNLNVVDFQIKVKKDHDFFQGGNAVMVVEGTEGTRHQIFISGLYFMGGEWYVLNKITLR